MKFYVNEKPKGKERPRHTRTGITYTPKSTKDYEKTIQQEAIRQLGNMLQADYEGDVKLRIVAKFAPPKSMSKKARERLGIGYTHKPDFDNIAKMVCDALNGVAWKDDKQITCALIIKDYADKDELEIEFEYLEG